MPLRRQEQPMGYHWNWGILLAPVATGEPMSYLGWLISGFEMTVLISLAGWVVAVVVGVLMGTLRTVRGTMLGAICASYVAVFRNIPLIVQFFIWFWVVPELLPLQIGRAVKHIAPAEFAVLCSIVCLGLFTSARVCEQVRAGLQALPRGQKDAALSLGLSLPQTYRHVLLPAALRIIVPALTSEFLNIFKNSSVASTIGLLELSAQAQRMIDYTSQAYESFLAVLATYALITGLIMFAMRRIENADRLSGQLGNP
jgi:glutamate/aspartate transport system permease protein